MRNDGGIRREFAARLAGKAFAHTSEYDRMIAAALRGKRTATFLAPEMDVPLRRIARLRYGENPHQDAALYALSGAEFKLLAGSDASYNNVQDAIAAWRSVREFDGGRLLDSQARKSVRHRRGRQRRGSLCRRVRRQSGKRLRRGGCAQLPA